MFSRPRSRKPSTQALLTTSEAEVRGVMAKLVLLNPIEAAFPCPQPRPVPLLGGVVAGEGVDTQDGEAVSRFDFSSSSPELSISIILYLETDKM